VLEVEFSCLEPTGGETDGNPYWVGPEGSLSENILDAGECGG
jgi:hypothetical protein